MRQHRRCLPGVDKPYLLMFPGLIRNKIPALLDVSENIPGALCVVILAVMFGRGVTEVFFRYVVEMSLSFPSELIRYLFVWSVALGSAVAMRKNSHAAIEMFVRSEEHTSELQSLMRISYAVFCLKKKKK